MKTSAKLSILAFSISAAFSQLAFAASNVAPTSNTVNTPTIAGNTSINSNNTSSLATVANSAGVGSSYSKAYSGVTALNTAVSSVLANTGLVTPIDTTTTANGVLPATAALASGQTGAVLLSAATSVLNITGLAFNNSTGPGSTPAQGTPASVDYVAATPTTAQQGTAASADYLAGTLGTINAGTTGSASSNTSAASSILINGVFSNMSDTPNLTGPTGILSLASNTSTGLVGDQAGRPTLNNVNVAATTNQAGVGNSSLSATNYNLGTIKSLVDPSNINNAISTVNTSLAIGSAANGLLNVFGTLSNVADTNTGTSNSQLNNSSQHLTTDNITGQMGQIAPTMYNLGSSAITNSNASQAALQNINQNN